MAGFVKHVGSRSSSDNATTYTVTIPAAGCLKGNFLLVRQAKSGSATITSVVDSKGNTYIDLGSLNTNVGNLLYGAVLTVALVSGDTITITMSAKGNRSMVVDEFVGVQPFTAVDGSGNGTSVASTTPSATTSPAPKKPGLVVAHVAVAIGTEDAYTEDTNRVGNASWTALTRTQVANATASSNCAYKIVEIGVGSQTYNPTLGASVGHDENVASLPIAVNIPNGSQRVLLGEPVNQPRRVMPWAI